MTSSISSLHYSQQHTQGYSAIDSNEATTLLNRSTNLNAAGVNVAAVGGAVGGILGLLCLLLILSCWCWRKKAKRKEEISKACESSGAFVTTNKFNERETQKNIYVNETTGEYVNIGGKEPGTGSAASDSSNVYQNGEGAGLPATVEVLFANKKSSLNSLYENEGTNKAEKNKDSSSLSNAEAVYCTIPDVSAVLYDAIARDTDQP